VHCVGKGRKERRTPLLALTSAVLRRWIAERHGAPADPLFPTSTGRRPSRDAVERRIAHYTAKASNSCPSLRSKHVTAHALRHTAAMRLLEAGHDITVIAPWLGHEQVSTANSYIHADMSHKERAIARTQPPGTKPGRYRPADNLTSPSSRPFDYADNSRPLTPTDQPIRAKVGIIRRSA
jgi:integrase/recombinase XerD